MQWNENALSWPFAEVIDGQQHFVGTAPEERTLQQIAEDYATWANNAEPRDITVRIATDVSGVGAWSNFTLPIVPPPPLENLAWNQGWPQYNGIPCVDVVDDSTHFWAVNPDGWSLARAAADYGASYACGNTVPHEVQVREISSGGNGEFSPFTVPVVPE